MVKRVRNKIIETDGRRARVYVLSRDWPEFNKTIVESFHASNATLRVNRKYVARMLREIRQRMWYRARLQNLPIIRPRHRP